MKEILESAKLAARQLPLIENAQISAFLTFLADKVDQSHDILLAANQLDLDRMDKDDPKFDRLKLTSERLIGIANDMRKVALMPSPLGMELDERSLPNGLEIKRISVPLGVVGIIYEARPNVTFDVFSLCLKSGNVCLLKGGSDAENSNKAIVELIKSELEANHLPVNAIELLPSDRSSTEKLLKVTEYVDVIIPRGSQQLIDFVRENSKVPVIETGAGIVHTFVDETADLQLAAKIITNAKTRRVSVCNALDCLIIHESRLIDLYELVSEMSSHEVQIFADEQAFSHLDGVYPDELLHKADATHFGTEFLSYKMAIKTVANLRDALDHIAIYSSKHSEAIITANKENAELFQKSVDAAVVYVNTSTAFTDGAQFGLGAEIGISTQKLHARGPMGLAELTSYKWLVSSNGSTRNP
ncbi:glutamate-5-semialdehyde dehydrogenase [bacterium]|nr:MAG: glutamate-5-semialdehyde dehydrogenase [bacterium]